MPDRVALLTGGTFGLGAAVAPILRARGLRVLIVSRTSPDNDDGIRLDLSDPHAAAALDARLHERNIHRLDLLIHNAAIACVATIEGHRQSDIEEMYRVNVAAPVSITRALWSRLQMAKGRVAFISSPVAWIPCPDFAVYAATKSAIEAFARSLRAEQNDVGVSVLRPPAMNTDMHHHAGSGRIGLDARRFARPNEIAPGLVSALLKGKSYWSSSLADSLVGNLFHRAPTAMSRFRQSKLTSHRLTRVGRQSVLVTGAAKGIGEALARQFAQAGWLVIGVDRDTDSLERARREWSLQEQNIQGVVADLMLPEDRQRILATLEQLGPLSAIIHNAGVNRFGLFSSSGITQQMQVLDTNLLAPMLLTSELLQKDLLSAGGTIAFVSSLSHFVGYPGSAVYAASKSGIASFASSLAIAGKHAGYHVASIFPGPTRTDQARENSPDNSKEASRMSPDRVAEIIARGIHQKRSRIIPGTSNQLFAFIGTWMPTFTEQIMTRSLLKVRQDTDQRS